MGKTKRNDIEKYFEWWLDDCKVAGYVESWSRESETFLLFKEYKGYRMNYFKTKDPEKEIYNVLGNMEYNYDYRIVWNPIAEDIFYNLSDWTDKNNPPVLKYKRTFFHAHPSIDKNANAVSYVDVKPPAKAAQYSGQLTSFATFPLKQRILLWNHGVYVNKCVPIPMSGSGHALSLFPNTFTPKRYFITDGGTMNRKIKYRIETLDSYVKKRKSFIGQIESMVRNVNEKKAKQGELFKG